MQSLAACALLALAAAAQAAPGDSSADITLRADRRVAARQGPLALAEALRPGIAPAQPAGLQLQAELRHTLRLPAGLALAANGLIAHERLQGRSGQDRSRVNELHAALDLGAWQVSAGKKVLGWDVGYGYRPNDVVQQQTRRSTFEQTPEGRPLLMLEYFGAETAAALVLVNPQRWTDERERQLGAHEAALALRGYARAGAVDLHAYARQGRHTGASLGAALAWVAGDELELHASARAFQRHDAWAQAGPVAALALANPWRQTLQGGGSQWLLGAQWSGGPRLSALLEAWHDGSAASDATWRDWGHRNAALTHLVGLAALRDAVAGNLAWQAGPFESQNLRQDNLYLRLAWQPGDWTWSVDALYTPADRGRVLSAALQFKGDRWRLDASWRVYGGPPTAVLAQLPMRRSVLLAATLAF